MLTKQAIELLQKVKAHVLEEPKRIDMNNWIFRKTQPIFQPDHGFPACGFVGCIAGWVCILSGLPNTPREDVERVAANILGLNHFDEGTLFLDSDLLHDGQQNGQTPEHANRVAAHIDRFIAERS